MRTVCGRQNAGGPGRKGDSIKKSVEERGNQDCSRGDLRRYKAKNVGKGKWTSLGFTDKEGTMDPGTGRHKCFQSFTPDSVVGKLPDSMQMLPVENLGR